MYHEVGHGIIDYINDLLEYTDEYDELYDKNQQLFDGVLDNEEVGKVIRRYLHINDVEGANKAIVEKARSKSVKKLEEINVVVVFLTGGRN